MELETLIKELKVDWDTVLTDEFNPLYLSLLINKGTISSAKFRDMYHKLENAMEKIISQNYKGFSDSVLAYNKFYNQNKELLNVLSETEQIVNEKEYDFEIDQITNDFTKTEYFSAKYEICRRLMDIKLTYEEYESCEQTLKRCYQLVKCLDLVDNKEYVNIKGVFEYRKLIYKSYMELTESINMEIFDFVFFNKINNSFKGLLILGSLYELEVFVKTYFRIFLYNAIEEIILKMYQEKVVLEKLCKLIMKKVENIIKNYETIIELTLKNFKLKKTESDFFGNQNEPYHYVTKLECILDIVKDELGRFINKYSVSTEFDNKFSLESIIDNVDYNKIYPEDYNIFKNKKNEDDQSFLQTINSSMEYTLIITPKIDIAAFLLKNTTNSVLRIFLNKKVETEYTKFKLEKSKKKLDFIFEEEIKCDPNNKTLSIYKDIQDILQQQKFNDDQKSYDKHLVSHLNKKIIKLFENIFDEIFVSKIVVPDRKKIFMYDGEKGGFGIGFEEEFKESLYKKYINKSSLLLKKSKYQKAIYSLNMFKDLDHELNTRETLRCYEVFYNSFKKQLNLEFFYYFDLFFREGNFTQNFYLRKIVSVFEFIYSETQNTSLFEGLYDNLIYYCKNNLNVLNVKTKEDVKLFIEQVRIFDEIMGEIEFHENLDDLYVFFDEILENKSNDENGKILQAKLRANEARIKK
ncbi:hypothetical protein EHP00_1807 [Ecytonucleospora hepatopenaei]|uniref:Exocyst complex component Sec8 N-terminal domain-containing protein n=1 Tax=Ecytonucleospora hepatopenaei TaxID=646526 RepID=A0A1W0E7B6_9MICR|nr:hypothetical protein EHP00_1807 [Ecytonucleospora hepatopenaei]